MEDKPHFQGESCYSFRIDIPTTESNDKILVNKMMEYFSRLVGGKENKKDGTMHYQCIVWSDKKLAKNCPQQLRTFFKQKFDIKHKNFMSLVSARKVRSLAKYCNDKENKGLVTFGINDLSALGKWDNPEDNKVKMKEQLVSELKTMNKSDIIDMMQVVKLAVKIYKGCRPPPFKSLLCIARSVGYISDSLFIQEYYGRDLDFCLIKNVDRYGGSSSYGNPNPNPNPNPYYISGDTESDSEC